MTYASSTSTESLMIRQGGVLKPGGMDVKTGYAVDVTVGLQKGVFVQGAWVIVNRSPNDSVGELSWSDSAVVQLIYEHDGELIALMAHPADKWPKQTLIKVAESLEAYEG